MSHAGTTRRWEIARAIERGDPRLGYIVGLAVSILVAIAFAAGVPVARRADDALMDLVFKWRPRVPESDRLVLVSMDDETFRELKWPIPRNLNAKVLMALDRLGAARVVFDVEFKSVAPRPEEYDEETGEFILDEGDRLLRLAIAHSGKAVLAYHLDLGSTLSPEVEAALPRLRDALGRDFASGALELSRVTGVPPRMLEAQLNAIRHQVARELVSSMLEKSPALSFPELKKSLLPRYDGRSDAWPLKALQYAYWVSRGRRDLEAKRIATKVEGLPSRAKVALSVVPPHYPFLEFARSAAPANAGADPDGVLRRPWAAAYFGGKPYLYLGLEGVLQAIAEPGEEVEVAVQPAQLRIRVRERSGGGVRREILLPTDEEGRLLVNWAGNQSHRRGSEEPYFSHVTFHDLLSFYEERYELRDRNVRGMLAGIAEETGAPYHPDYAALSERRAALLREGRPESGDELRMVEDRLEAECRAMAADFNAELAEIQKGLAGGPPDRLRKRMEEHADRMRRHLQLVSGPAEREARLRKDVQGKVCWIGSSSTASGDLHSTPLGSATPGLDVLAHVANMVLTGQAVRPAPPWSNVAFMLLAGLAVTWGVVHWNTTWSLLFTLSVMVSALGIYAYFFAGRGVLLSGMGPFFTALLTFAAVMAFKELVTQRSKRKLQRELEKNTSPELVGILMEHPEFLAKPRKMIGTFFFSDVKSFTSISEKMKAEVLVPYINRYLDRTTQALKGRQAYLDKYIGDGIMALFGIPVPSADHARNACLAALECQSLLKDLNTGFAAEGLPEIKSRIGIHSGEAIAGYVGGDTRSEYTVLGDNVNLAARLEGANKEYDTSIMISEATHDLVSGRFLVRELDKIRVVGKRNAVRIFELLAPAGTQLPFDPRFLGEYEAALAAFKERRWRDAIEGFEKALALKPGDKPCEVYISRANAFQVSPPPGDWEGVFELLSK